MKRHLTILLMSAHALTLQAQNTFCENNYILTFEETYQFECISSLFIDTTSNPNNCWQIGTPSKTEFDSAYSAPRAILTDTLNHYPVNDTSVFTITNAIDFGFQFVHTAVLACNYKVETDSLNDYGLIEFSPDNGTTWIDILNDTVYSDRLWWSPNARPTLTGKTNGWAYMEVNLAPLGYYFDMEFGDTVQYRFTFISDGITEDLDGIMFDNFFFLDYVEGVNEYSTTISSSAFPNPAVESLNIEFENPQSADFELSILDAFGRQLYKRMTKSQRFSVSTDLLVNGIYYYRLTSAKMKQQSHGRFVVAKK